MPTDLQRSWLLWLARAAVCAAILLLGAYLIVWQWLGSSEAAWALLRGEELAVVPVTLDIGDCRPGDVKACQLRVVSMSSSRVALTGMHTSCSCIVTSALPATLEPRGALTLRMTVHPSGDAGDFARQAVLYTDSQYSPELPIVVVGRMLESQDDDDLAPIPQPVPAPMASDD
jgi:hypothetical protein